MKAFARRRERLVDFHRPERSGVAHPLKPESIACLRNLSKYKRPPAPGRYPRSCSAAVLVALFVGRGGDLYALLSRRADNLRAYPGDTSLPGGKLEPIDRSIENAARREAFEEIGLPLDKTKVPLLCILEPFLAGNSTIVTPVVVLITDQTLRPILNAAEVQSVFSHPLQSFLTTKPLREAEPRPRKIIQNSTQESQEAMRDEHAHRQDWPLAPRPEESRVPFAPEAPPSATSATGSSSRPAYSAYEPKRPSEERPYHSYTDVLWHGNNVRMHRFLTGRESEGVKPIFGMTSAVLIRVAQIGYGIDPEFEVNAPGQPALQERIRIALHKTEKLRRACLLEGIGSDWGITPDEAAVAEPSEATRKNRRAKL